MTTDTVARYLDRTPDAIRSLVARGAIPSLKVGGVRVFGTQEIDAWVRSGGKVGEE